MILAISMALAYQPELEGHLTAGVGGDPDQVPVNLGVGATLALPTWRRLHLELNADYGLMRDRGRFGLLAAGPRVFIGDPLDQVVSVFARGGLGLQEQVGPAVHGGLSVDLERGARVRPRLSLGYVYSPADPNRLLLQVGAVLGRRALPVPEVEEAPLLGSVPADRPAVATPERGMLWVPDPVCTWLPIEEANAKVEELSLTLTAPSVVSERLLRAPDAPVEPVFVPTTDTARPGRVVVVTSDADQVLVGEEEVQVEGGVGIGSPGTGMTWVEVRGGGRSLRVPVFAVERNAIWLPVDGPSSQRIGFQAGSSTLAPDALGTLGRLAELRGAWAYQVRGSYSVEGDLQTNRRLAMLRAETIRQALLDAGVPPGSVQVAEPLIPDENASPEDQRAAHVIPLESL